MELAVTRVREQLSQEWGSIIMGTASINSVSTYKPMRNMTTQYGLATNWKCAKEFPIF